MGAFADYIQATKDAVNGSIPIGGTFFPVSDFSIIPAFLARGATFPLPNLDVLKDLPYDLLVMDMEVVVSEHEISEEETFPRTRYRLTNLPAEGTRLSDIEDVDINDYWTEIPLEASSEKGDAGFNGWAYVPANEADGPNRIVQKVVDWIGGSGPKPGIPNPPYIGPNGFTTKAAAINIKGSAGDVSIIQVRPQLVVSVGQKVWSTPNTNIATSQGWLIASPTMTVENTWNQPRYIHLFGEVPVSNDSGPDSFFAQLEWSTTNVPTSWGIGDANYAREDYVNYSFQGHPGAVRKIKLDYVDVIQPGAKKYYRLRIRHVHGTAGRYSQGFLIAIGL